MYVLDDVPDTSIDKFWLIQATDAAEAGTNNELHTNKSISMPPTVERRQSSAADTIVARRPADEDGCDGRAKKKIGVSIYWRDCQEAARSSGAKEWCA